MRLTMQNAEALLEAIETLQGAFEEIEDDLRTWIDLDGETDTDSREQRRDARETYEGGIEELASAALDLSDLLNPKARTR